MRKLLLASMAVLICLGIAPRARAQPASDAAALALFDDGHRLISEGRIDDACRAFEASMALAPKLGVQLNLADCYERAGRTASAWLAFSKAAALARPLADGRGPWARQRLAALAPRLSRLVIAVAAPRAGLVVRLDGAIVAPSVYGVAVPVDPGEHVIAAEVPGAPPWSQRVTIARGVERTTVEVAPPVPPPRPPVLRYRAATWATASLGVASLGAGSFFGLSAWLGWRHTRAGCEGSICHGDAYEDATRAHRAGTLATTAFVVGGVALGAALVFHLRGRPPARLVAQAAPGTVGIGIAGGF